MKKLFLLFPLLCCSLLLLAQKKHSISGTVRSAAKGETLINASLKVNSGTAGTLSNEYGYYSLLLPEGAYDISISAVGMEEKSISIRLFQDTVMNIQLENLGNELEEVVIVAGANRRNIQQPQMGMERLSMKEINTIPVLLGERDALKVLQLLPGIKAAGDGNSGFYVRGGAADHNLILLDEAPVYNASHLLGFFSTFNSDAIKDITVYKGGMPAQYGGRLASVLDIHMNDGNSKAYGVSGGIGLISTKLAVEGPIQKEESSFLISGRRTYADMFLGLSKDTLIKDNTLYFYDLNAKVNYSLGEKDRLFLSGYFGRDKLEAGNDFGLNWGNATGTLRWNHIFGPRLFSNTSLIFSNFDYEVSVNSGNSDFRILSKIEDLHLKHEYQWNAGSNHQVKFGLQSIHHTIKPGQITANSNSDINSTEVQNRKSWENAFYATDNWKLSPVVQVSYGLRLNSFSVLGGGEYYEIDPTGKVVNTIQYAKGSFVKTYIHPEPRLAVSYTLNANSSVKASYVRNTQNLHLLSNSLASSPTDKWISSTNIVRPQIADQVAVGYYLNFGNSTYELSTEAYYKDMQHQIDYRDGANIYSNNDAIESQLLFGKGRAYGLETLIKKRAGDFTGWLSYTLSKTERKIDGINNNEWYNARQDRTHDVAIVGMYSLNKKWSLSATWVYYTGDAVTFPTGKYKMNNQTVFYYSDRNAYRMPAYHRLDLGAVLTLKKTERKLSELAFSIFNAYGRENAYTINFRDSKTKPGETEAVQIALFRFIPSISWNFKF